MPSKAIELITQVKDFCKISDTSYDTLILQKLNLVQWQLYNSHFHWRDLETFTTLTTTETMTLNVAPSTAWAVGDTITGATSLTTSCTITEVLSTLTFHVKNRNGSYTLGEVLTNGTYTADQGTAYPTFSSDSYIPAPTDLGILYDLRQTDVSPYAKLTYLTPQKFHSLIPQPTEFAEGSPLYYTWWGGRLYFYPIPDQSYDLTAFYYKKPTNMKLYSTVTAAHSGITWTGTTTFWLNNLNVVAGMFVAYQADVLSDGTYPWAKVAGVTTNTALTTTLAYTGASGATTVAYWANSESTFTDFFDLALIYGATIMMGATFREIRESSPWFQEQYKEQLAGLAEAQVSIPDQRGIVEDFTPVAPQPNLTGQEYKYPFIRSS